MPPFLERQIETLTAVKINVALLRDSMMERPQRSDAVIRQALGVTQEIFRRADGKPFIIGDHHVSVAHSSELSLAVASLNTVSCDMELIVDHEEDFWLSVLGTERIALVEQLMKQSGTENYNTSATRIWTLQECLKKAELPLTTPVTLKSSDKNGWTVLEAGDYVIDSFTAQLKNRRSICLGSIDESY
ncbi:MAG: hypothetical protein ACXWTS_00655 [Methylococcaceae bacterium]